jgi:hypothetical protein
VLGRTVAHGFGLSAQPSWGIGPRHDNGVRTPGALMARSPCAVHVRDDALTGGAVVVGRWQGVAGEHQWIPGVAPGNVVVGRAHPKGNAAVRREGAR